MSLPNYSNIPTHMRDSLQGYVENGAPIGGFLRLMMEHKIYEAAGKADEVNLMAIPHYIYFMYNWIPVMAHGSAEAVNNWVQFKIKEREDGR